MKQFDRLIGEWHGQGEFPDPPTTMSAETTVERMDEFIVIRSVAEPAELPDSISIVGGAPEGEPQPMHYFDGRGVKRMFLMAIARPGRPPNRDGAPGLPAAPRSVRRKRDDR